MFLILAIEESMKDYKKEGEGPMENTIDPWAIEHFRICVERHSCWSRIKSLGQGLVSDCDSVIRSREGQK